MLENVMQMTDSEKFKFYMKEYKEAPEAEKTAGAVRKKSSSCSYAVTFSSGLDAVIEKRMGKGTIQMVLMPSQDKYLFKDDTAVQDIRSIPFDYFKLFFTLLPEDGIHVGNLVIDTLRKDDASKLHDMILHEDKRLNKGLMSLEIYKNGDVLAASRTLDAKLWKMLVTKTGIMNNTKKYGIDFLNVVQYFFSSRGYDAARMFAEAYTKSSMLGVSSSNAYYYRRMNVDLSPLNPLDPKTLIEYLCFGLYSQGFEVIPIRTYLDYLRMCVQYEGKVRDKYPDALLTAHDKISLKFSERKSEIDERNFKSTNEAFRKAMKISGSTVFEYGGNVMLIPGEAKELIDEGYNLGHCVGSYVNRVASGECVIVFVRKKAHPEDSYLTVELSRRNEFGKSAYMLAQIQGDCKRTILTEEEIDFFKRFMDKYSIQTRNRNFV